MAPQVKEKKDGKPSTAANWKLLPTFAERDAVVRSHEDRRRGWSDYRVLFVGTDTSKGQLSEEEIIRGVSGDTEKFQSRGRSGYDTWNTFEIRGEEKIVSLLTPPVMYGRFPNYRARDLIIQSADAIILVITPHVHDLNAIATFEMIRKSLEGGFKTSYSIRISTETLDNVKDLAPEQPRPVYILLSESREKYDLVCKDFKEERRRLNLVERPTRPFKEAMQKVRSECMTFMKDFGDAHGVKFITLPDNCKASDLSQYVIQACEDVSDNAGVRFEVNKVSVAPIRKSRRLHKKTENKEAVVKTFNPSVSDTTDTTSTAFPTLDKISSVVVEDEKKSVNNWNLFAPMFDSTVVIIN